MKNFAEVIRKIDQILNSQRSLDNKICMGYSRTEGYPMRDEIQIRGIWGTSKLCKGASRKNQWRQTKIKLERYPTLEQEF